MDRAGSATGGDDRPERVDGNEARVARDWCQLTDLTGTTHVEGLLAARERRSVALPLCPGT